MFSFDFHRKVLRKLDEIISELKKKLVQEVNSFSIRGGIVNINAGQSTTLTATPLAAPIPPAITGLPTTLPTGDVPVWKASDPTKVTATPSVDGLSLVVAVLPTALPGDVVFQISDALIPAATGTFTLTIVGAVPAPVASFDVIASTPV